MSRLNLTLDDDTFEWIERHAARHKIRQAALARQLLQEAVARREAIAQRRKLAADYAAGREDAAELLQEMESGELALLNSEQ